MNTKNLIKNWKMGREIQETENKLRMQSYELRIEKQEMRNKLKETGKTRNQKFKLNKNRK